jgi:hypothetical protein
VVGVGLEPGDLAEASACISKKGDWEAGTYEGTVQVYGPRFTEFSYPLVVTSKWPVWVPLAIIVLVVFLAVAAGAVTCFAQYDSADTWGDNPETQLAGLAVAVITAAAAGRAASMKVFGGD